MDSASTGDSFTGSGSHPEVTYTVRIDGVSINHTLDAAPWTTTGIKRNCRSCVYGDFELETENIGRCRRNSPVPGNELKDAKWPLVAWNDWCGEWECK